MELSPLTAQDLRRILSGTDNALIKQYTELLAVDNINLTFTPEALDLIADYAFAENESHENIGARRLVSVMEKLLDEISFTAGDPEAPTDVLVDPAYIDSHLGAAQENKSLAKYIL